MFDLVHHLDDGWYFWDEIGDECGPYLSQFDAQRELCRYCLWLEHGETILGGNHLMFVIPEQG